MGRLAGFRYREVAKRRRKLGFVQKHDSAGSHELWINYYRRKTLALPWHSGDLPEGTLRSVLKQAGIAEDDFLA